MSDLVFKRCAPDGHACPDVYERVRAAHDAKYREGHSDCAEQLLAAARRVAALHNYGQAGDLEEAS